MEIYQKLGRSEKGEVGEARDCDVGIQQNKNKAASCLLPHQRFLAFRPLSSSCFPAIKLMYIIFSFKDVLLR